MTKTRPRIGFIGAGKVGSALACALAAEGYAVVAIASRRFASARALAARLPAAEAFESPQAGVEASDLVFITTPDEAIREAVAAITWREGVAAVHTSGSESRDALRAAAEQGASTGSLHPLQSFADLGQASVNLPGSVFAVEAEGELRETLLTVVADLGGSAIELQAEDKALYHASAVLVSNYIVTLTKLASDLWLRFGWERPAAVKALLPLLHGAVSNIESLGVPAALTGPVARGDVETVRRHLAALGEGAPALLAPYRELALQTLPIALARGGLSDSAAGELRRLLSAEPASHTPRRDANQRMRTMLRGKIHRATVTQANVDYEGSITIDPVLLEAADILPFEQVHVLDINNGVRLETYAIEGKRASGVIGINGAAARLIDAGDLVIILAYDHQPESEARLRRPRLVYVNERNEIVRVGHELPAGAY